MERRWGNRIPLDKQVRITRDGEVIAIASLHEASVSGAFVRTPMLLRNLTRIGIELCADGIHGDPEHRIEAYVVRQCPDGFGIEWCQFGPDVIVDMLREPQHQPLPVMRGPDWTGWKDAS
jgi:hypothetical protein